MFEKDIPLAQHSNYKIGGPARFFFVAKDIEGLQAAAAEAKKASLPIFILGGGTNLLISDDGFPGLVIKTGFSKMQIENGMQIRVGAGVLVKDLLDFCIANSLSGLEWAGGLPGTVGGAVWGNAGAFKGEIKDSVIEVVSMDINSPQGPSTGRPARPILRTNSECEFGYRTSVFKKLAGDDGLVLSPEPARHREVIIEVVFRLINGEREAIQAAIQEKINYRMSRQPLDYPNIGSIFKNIDLRRVPSKVLKQYEHKIKMDPFPVLPTAVLIDTAGLKGVKAGGAMISPKHPNFIINATGRATAADVKILMEMVKTELRKQFGVELEQEVIFL